MFSSLCIYFGACVREYVYLVSACVTQPLFLRSLSLLKWLTLFGYCWPDWLTGYRFDWMTVWLAGSLTTLFTRTLIHPLADYICSSSNLLVHSYEWLVFILTTTTLLFVSYSTITCTLILNSNKRISARIFCPESVMVWIDMITWAPTEIRTRLSGVTKNCRVDFFADFQRICPCRIPCDLHNYPHEIHFDAHLD